MGEDSTNEVEDQRAPYVHPEDARDFRVREHQDAKPQDVRDYIGVTDEYKTYANSYDAPILTDTERFLHTDQYNHLEGNLEQAAGGTSEGSMQADEVSWQGETSPQVDLLPPVA